MYLPYYLEIGTYGSYDTMDLVIMILLFLFFFVVLDYAGFHVNGTKDRVLKVNFFNLRNILDNQYFLFAVCHITVHTFLII